MNLPLVRALKLIKVQIDTLIGQLSEEDTDFKASSVLLHTTVVLIEELLDLLGSYAEGLKDSSKTTNLNNLKGDENVAIGDSARRDENSK